MLIRWATENDLPAWCALATEVSPIFQFDGSLGDDDEWLFFAKRKIANYEALTAVDYMSGVNIGFIALSRSNNRVSWVAVSEQHRQKGVGSRLLKTALRQLDTNKGIEVTAFRGGYSLCAAERALYEKFGFAEKELTGQGGLLRSVMIRPASNEKRGSSFHYRYPEFIKASQPELCPVCNSELAPDGQNDIQANDQVWIVGEYPGQGGLFGKMYVMPRDHAFHFEDMPESDAIAFMSEVQRVARALRKVTGAEKINYEMHSNSGAHLHIHLCPRYLDDNFPSMSIDLHIPSDPAPYESYEEFLWFVERMREELR